MGHLCCNLLIMSEGQVIHSGMDGGIPIKLEEISLGNVLKKVKLGNSHCPLLLLLFFCSRSSISSSGLDMLAKSSSTVYWGANTADLET